MNIKMYGISSSSSRKAYEWLNKHQIPFTYKNALTEQLAIDEIKHIFKVSKNGTEDILSTKSKLYKDLLPKIEKMTLQELYECIQQHPKLLRYPIIVDEHKLQVGFSEYEIRQFIPKERRKRDLLNFFTNEFNAQIEGI